MINPDSRVYIPPEGAELWRERFLFILLPLLALGMATAVLWLYYRQPRISIDATVISSVDHREEAVSFPFTRAGAAQERLDFAIAVTFKKGEETVFKIIPDDCVESIAVNGQPVALEGRAAEERCNHEKGFRFDFGPYLHEGRNDIHIEVLNLEGDTGLQFKLARFQKMRGE